MKLAIVLADKSDGNVDIQVHREGHATRGQPTPAQALAQIALNAMAAATGSVVVRKGGLDRVIEGFE